MQSVANILKKELPKHWTGSPTASTTQVPATSSGSSTDEAITADIHRLFAKFAVYYHHIWKSLFKEEKMLMFAKKEWQAVLSPFSSETIASAIRECLNIHTMPPSLPEFLGLCRYYQKRDAIPECIAEPYIRTAESEAAARRHLHHILQQLRTQQGASYARPQSQNR